MLKTLSESDSEICQAQKKLNRLMPVDFALVADGRMGPKTQLAIEAFQKRHHLTVTGVVDAVTRKRLDSAAPFRPRSFSGLYPEWSYLKKQFAKSLQKLLYTSEFLFGHQLVITSIYRSPDHAQNFHVAHMISINAFTRHPKHAEKKPPHRIDFGYLSSATLASQGWGAVDWTDYLADKNGNAPKLDGKTWVRGTEPDEAKTRAKAFKILADGHIHADKAGRAHAAQVAPGYDACKEPCNCGGRCSRHCLGLAVDIAFMSIEDRKKGRTTLETILQGKSMAPLDTFLRGFGLHRPLWTEKHHNEYWHVEPIVS